MGIMPADGIGKEVVPEAVRVLQTILPNKFNFIELEAGWECFQKNGTSLPEQTIQKLRECDSAIFGAVSSPSHKVKGYSSPIVAMRNKLELYANLRPIVSVPVKGSMENIDMLIVRENTEGLYVKDEELSEDGEVAIARRRITKKASMRIAKMAFEQALNRPRVIKEKGAMVTIVHKSNVLSVTDGLFRECCLQVAKDYPTVKVEEQLVDSMLYKLFLQPQYYDVVVAPNLYGDILSDAAAALVGGLGLAPSANVGDTFIMAEPVHGSAPDIEGKGIANPIATIRATAMVLQQLEQGKYKHLAVQIERAITTTLQQNICTPDLGGSNTCSQVTDAILRNLHS